MTVLPGVLRYLAPQALKGVVMSNLPQIAPSYFAPSGAGPAYTFPLNNVHFTEDDEVLLQRMIAIRNMQEKRPPVFDRVWLKDQPPHATPFIFTERRLVSDMAASTTYTLINERVPSGYRGVITDRACWFQGSGFVEGSSQLTWSLLVGSGYAYKQGQLRFSIGPDDGTSLVGLGGILLLQDQLLRFQVTTGDISGLDSSGLTIARLKGWFLPDDQQSEDAMVNTFNFQQKQRR